MAWVVIKRAKHNLKKDVLWDTLVNMGVDLGGWEGVMVCDPLTGGRSENLGATKSRRDIRSHSPLISYLHTRPNIKNKQTKS